MKSIKGLILLLSMSAMAFTSINDSPTSKEIKDNIFTAIRSIDYTSINILLADGTDIDTVDQQGNTPLMVAAKIGNPRILNIIFSHNPEINNYNNEGLTALMIAAKTGQFSTVQKLVRRGANISHTDQDGKTALTFASKYGHKKIVTFLKKRRILTPYSK
ncbi:ankyrin repeat domain-containing protein [Fodinibius halophilus]|uniref:Ankyrin repeat domain-containing protein n=1 Tax=Fodinibius halophilus TaxID=1736908 RepID=A0A6M1TEY9_9BACT|nr:ankyrin repeat domain-containing protein [Fodinibius halophilus]NGP87180.1 ankyrin repeat domain-containing protein [Fodinibius halophilus]